MTNIFAVLREDHDIQRELLDRIEQTEGDSPERRSLFDQLKKEAIAHAAAEERVFYAELLADETTREHAGHSIKEHKEAEDIIAELDEMDMSSPGWLNRFKTLAHDLRHHVEEEEKEVFPVAGRTLSEQKKKELGRDFRDDKPVHELEKLAS